MFPKKLPQAVAIAAPVVVFQVVASFELRDELGIPGRYCRPCPPRYLSATVGLMIKDGEGKAAPPLPLVPGLLPVQMPVGELELDRSCIWTTIKFRAAVDCGARNVAQELAVV